MDGEQKYADVLMSDSQLNAAFDKAYPDKYTSWNEDIQRGFIDGWQARASIPSAQPSEKCVACGGNDMDAPCAYPRKDEAQEECLRNKRLAQPSDVVDELLQATPDSHESETLEDMLECIARLRGWEAGFARRFLSQALTTQQAQNTDANYWKTRYKLLESKQQAQSGDVARLVEAVQTWSEQLTIWFAAMNESQSPKNRAALIAAWSRYASRCSHHSHRTRGIEMAEEVATRICNFCGLSEHDVSVLIAGPSVFICGECVYLAARITSKAYYDKATRLDKEVEIIDKAETLQEQPND